MDLTVMAIPGYFGTMGAEYLWLKKKADERGPTAADYEWRDALTSLAMGQISLVAPLLRDRYLGPVTPGKGRYGKVVVGVALGAAAVVTVADLVAKGQDGRLPEAGTVPTSASEAPATEAAATAADGAPRDRRRRLARVARKVAGSGAVTAFAAAGLAAGTAWANRFTSRKQFEHNDRDLGSGALAVGAAIVAWDFLYYWSHRFQHESRYLWAMHVVHHSSEHYNLSTALRQPVVEAVTLTVPYGMLARLGFRPSVIETARGVNLLYQYWVHTETVPKLERFEKVFNSPSLHRVHHGSNQKYLDRNHGGIFSIWDRLFGTYQPEEEQVVYGLTRNIGSFRPDVVMFHEWRDMARDVAGADNWSDRLGFVFRGPGWAYERRAELAAETIRRSPEPTVPASSAA